MYPSLSQPYMKGIRSLNPLVDQSRDRQESETGCALIIDGSLCKLSKFACELRVHAYVRLLIDGSALNRKESQSNQSYI